MKNIWIVLAPFFLHIMQVTCSAVAAAPSELSHQSRTTETCADPSLATTFINIFSTTRTAHGVRAKMDMVNYDTAVGTTDNFQFQGPSFLAWRDPQEFTVPFYQFETPSGNDIIYLPAVIANSTGAATPPAAKGYILQAIVGYAYTTQVCGSVPLYAAANAAASDHWWTTSLSEHTALLKLSGWLDAGVPFYVLPLDCSCSAT